MLACQKGRHDARGKGVCGREGWPMTDAWYGPAASACTPEAPWGLFVPASGAIFILTIISNEF